MYMDYSKLWKFLLEKNMTKTDLITLTGISSRVMAKLSKNGTVTTETLGRICTALHCGVSDIMECVSEDSLSLYAAYKKRGVCMEETPLCQIVHFMAEGQEYVVYKIKETANRQTKLTLEADGAVYWQQTDSDSLSADPAKTRLIRPCLQNTETGIVLFKGTPGSITRDPGAPPEDRLFLLTEAAFKLFTPPSFVHT